MKFPTDAEIQFQSKNSGPLIPVRVRTVIRLWGSPTHIRIPTHIRTDGNLENWQLSRSCGRWQMSYVVVALAAPVAAEERDAAARMREV